MAAIDALDIDHSLMQKGDKPLASKRFIILHYTAGPTVQSAYNGMKNVNLSAHFIVGREGGIYQMVPLEDRALHAGQSQWQGLTWLNNHSIGIEIVNWGLLKKGTNQTWTGKALPEDEIYTDANGNDWHHYAEKQLASVNALVDALALDLKAERALRHSDIAPGRKTDTGPAFDFDMKRFNFTSGFIAKTLPNF